MKLKGYFYFLDKWEVKFVDKLILALLEESGIALELFFSLNRSIKCKSGRIYNLNNNHICGFTIVFRSEQLVHKLVAKGTLKEELLVSPSMINDIEWDKKDRLRNVKYYKDLEEFMGYINGI